MRAAIFPALCESLAKPLQKPFPPVWIPGSRNPSTMTEVASAVTAISFFAQPRGENPRAQTGIRRGAEKHGDPYHPFRFGILMSTYVAETDQQAARDAKKVFGTFEKLSQGSPAPRRTPTDLRSRRAVHPGRGVARVHEELHAWPETFGRRGKLGRARSVPVDYRRSPEQSRRRIQNLIEKAKVGNLLDSVQLGNMPIT